MAYTNPFVLLTVKGHLGSQTGIEIWTTHFKFANGVSEATIPLLPAFLTDVAPKISTFHSANTTAASANCWLTELDAAVIGTDGKYLDGGSQATTVYTYASPVAGVGSGTNPWSTACVLTLGSQVFVRGRGSHGRVYWPAIGKGISITTGRWSQGETDLHVATAKTLLDGLNTSSKSKLHATTVLCMVSKLGAGVTTVVDRVRVGGKPDSIERRENASPEVYSALSLA